jgi:hypothetical protein
MSGPTPPPSCWTGAWLPSTGIGHPSLASEQIANSYLLGLYKVHRMAEKNVVKFFREKVYRLAEFIKEEQE